MSRAVDRKDNKDEGPSHPIMKSTKSNNKTSGKKPKKKIADSWEDEDESSEAESEKPESAAVSTATPSEPSSTPFVPGLGSVPNWDNAGGSGSMPLLGNDLSKRPEKTDAVARRFIASSLGLKVPKQTEEQKVYQRSIREQEQKRREQERAEAQRRLDEAEKAKAAVWDD